MNTDDTTMTMENTGADSAPHRVVEDNPHWIVHPSHVALPDRSVAVGRNGLHTRLSPLPMGGDGRSDGMNLSAASCRPARTHEKCAVFGVSLLPTTKLNAAGFAYNGLVSLQHRGQEGAGIAVPSSNGIVCTKDVGLCSEVFKEDSFKKIPTASAAIGHNRYSTSGAKSTREDVQPMVCEYLIGEIAIAHNGNITNTDNLRAKLQKNNVFVRGSSDSAVVASLVAWEIFKADGDIAAGVAAAGEQLCGAYSLLCLAADGTLVALRDPDGYRPLCLGISEDGFLAASESCALAGCGFEFLRDIDRGEMVVIKDGIFLESRKLNRKQSKTGGLCLFEFVYFARTDSVLDGMSVYRARYNMGRMLFFEHAVDADVVCGVPDSGIEAAHGYAAAAGIPFSWGFVRNRYIGRTFIYPTQRQREDAVRMKLSPLPVNVAGMRVVLVDDSLVRGTTMTQIVALLREAGAKEIHIRISSPPFCSTCSYGTDIPTLTELVSNQMSAEAFAAKIGADSLCYISLDGLKNACEGCRVPFCGQCFVN